MNSQRHSVNEVFAQSISQGSDFASVIQDAVADLCFLMQNHHGFMFEPMINQELGYIMIMGRPSKEVSS